MSNEKTGGPAYPSANDVRIDTPQGAMGTGGHPGMTLLDHFAGMVMQSIMANGASLTKPTGRPRGPRPVDGISRTTMIGSKITQADLKALRAVMKATGIATQSAAVTLAIRAFAKAHGITVQADDPSQLALGSDKGAAEVSYRIAAAMIAERKRIMEHQ